MIGFVVLGIVMLIWVLSWDAEDTQDLGPAQSRSERHA